MSRDCKWPRFAAIEPGENAERSESAVNAPAPLLSNPRRRRFLRSGSANRIGLTFERRVGTNVSSQRVAAWA